MKSTRNCLFLVIGLLLLAGLIGLVWLGLSFLQQRQEQAQLEYLPPIVQIINPQDGAIAPVGSYLSAASTITFSPQNPVQTVEWWLDGSLLESHPIQAGIGVAQTYDYLNLLIPAEGTHMLLARAINTQGVIGPSEPLTFQGVAKGEAFYDLTVNEGETIESLAANYGTDVISLQNLNPGLGTAPAPGTTIKVPVPPENEPNSPLPNTPPAGIVTLVPTLPMLQVAKPPIGGLFNLLLASPPETPTNLQGEVKDCMVKLLWEDNASNESGYEIWIAAPGAPLKHMLTLGPAQGGVTWFEFNAPGPGYFLFWVEAVNSIGRQGSNIIYLNVDAGCPAVAPTHLQVDILDIAVKGGSERVYCYLSFENAPELRLPAQNGQFIAVQGGQGDLAAWPHTFALSTIPQDNTLDLSGECWGWTGKDLDKLGTFAASLGSETWDGAPRLVPGGTFDVSLSVLPQGTDTTRTTYVNNGGFPAVYNLRLEYLEECYLNPPLGCWHLIWDFDPPPGNDWYFDDIYWTDEQNNWHFLRRNMPSYTRTITIAQGGRESLVQTIGCGKIVYFYVNAVIRGPANPNTNYGVIQTLGVMQYQLPNCPASLTVTFDNLELPWTGDGAFAGPCDEIEVYYTMMVNGAIKEFWSSCSFGEGCFVKPLQCGTYTFKDLASPTYDPYPDRITVPVYSEELALKIVTLFHDSDWGSGDDLFAPYVLYHSWDTRAQAEAELGCNGKSFVTNKYVNDTADSILHYTISIFPNPCNPYTPW